MKTLRSKPTSQYIPKYVSVTSKYKGRCPECGSKLSFAEASFLCRECGFCEWDFIVERK